MNSIVSSDANEGHQDLGIYADSESIKSNNSKNENQIQIIQDENHPIKENDNKTIKKIHHNLSSFSELGDFLSESAPNTAIINSSQTNHKTENAQPKQKSQNRNKKKPIKRQPIKIDFSKIFSQDNNFNFPDEPKENSASITNINSNISFVSGENDLAETKNQANIDVDQKDKEVNTKRDEMLDNIENRIMNYFNRSLNFMISDFTNDLRDLLIGMNTTDSLIHSFEMDLKKNIRQIINFKNPQHLNVLDINSIESTLLSYKSFFLDINYFNPSKINEINDSIDECKKSVTSQINKLNTQLTPTINEFQNELSELHQLQQSILQKESKAEFKRSSIFQRLAELEYSEIMQKTESDLFSLKRSRSNLSTPQMDDDDDDNKEFLNQIYKFIKYYKRIQNNTYYKETIKRYSKLINDTFDDLQNSCDIYNLKIRNIFSSINYVQNQKNLALISSIRNTMILNDQFAMSNNINSNNTFDINTNENIKQNTINPYKKDILNEKQEINKFKKRDHIRNNDRNKSEIRYIEDLRRHDHKRFHHKSSK